MKLLYVLYSGDCVNRKIGEKGSWYSYYFTLSDVPTEGDEIFWISAGVSEEGYIYKPSTIAKTHHVYSKNLISELPFHYEAKLPTEAEEQAFLIDYQQLPPNGPSLIESCKKHFKDLGYKKSGTNWFNYHEKIVCCFRIHKSRWKIDADYYNVYVGIIVLGIADTPKLDAKIRMEDYNFQAEIDMHGKKIDEVINEIIQWHDKYSDIELLRSLANKKLFDDHRQNSRIVNYTRISEIIKALG